MQFFLQLTTQFYSQAMLISKECLYLKNTLAKCDEDAYLPILHLSTVELRCHNRVTAP